MEEKVTIASETSQKVWPRVLAAYKYHVVFAEKEGFSVPPMGIVI